MASPSYNMERFVIYIKSGIYKENVVVPLERWNITFIGDGIGQTVISSAKNQMDGSGIKESGALVVFGQGFLAINVTFENISGPTKEQAVAVRSAADRTVFYQCSFYGYQDTLYAQKGLQFYRQCDIYGIIDFIFGDATMVLQNCNIMVKLPIKGQFNTIIAQGKDDMTSKSGTVIQNCSILPADDLLPMKSKVKSYLGRPWKKFSTTIVMQSYIGDLVDPRGWSEWNESWYLDTLFYREYDNRGPASGTAMRVDWPGYAVIKNSSEALEYTVDTFIDGSHWLPQTNVPFNKGLI